MYTVLPFKATAPGPMPFQVLVATCLKALVPRSKIRNPLDIGVEMTALFAWAEIATSCGRDPAGSATLETVLLVRLMIEIEPGQDICGGHLWREHIRSSPWKVAAQSILSRASITAATHSRYP